MPSEPKVAASDAVACRRCGQTVDASRAVYSAQGELICVACASAAGASDGLRRQVQRTCALALGCGALSVVCNPLLVLSVIALVQGGRALGLLDRSEVKAALGARHRSMRTRAAAGMVLAAVGALLWLMLMPLVWLAFAFGEGMRRAL